MTQPLVKLAVKVTQEQKRALTQIMLDECRTTMDSVLRLAVKEFLKTRSKPPR